ITAATKNVTLDEIIVDITSTRPAISERKMMHHHQEGVKQILLFWSALKGLLEKCGITTEWEPTIPIVGSEIGSFPFVDARHHLQQMREKLAKSIADQFIWELDAGFQKLRIGRIKFEDRKACEFSFFERTRSQKTTLLTRVTDVNLNIHTLVNVKKHRLPAEHLVIPNDAKLIIAAMPRQLMKYGFIVTGDRILKKSDTVKEESERIGLGKFVDAAEEAAVKTANAIARNGKAIGVGALAAASAVGAGLMAASIPVATTAVTADPALVLGEHVFIGWD
ncbi:MAG: hypothetical protein R3B91_23570, partial [Planctomycetaceae bacterium]